MEHKKIEVRDGYPCYFFIDRGINLSIYPKVQILSYLT